MSARELNVYLDGTPMGALVQTGRGDQQFFYEESYLSRANPTPLSLSMPTASRFYRGKPVRAYLDNLLPDNIGVRQEWGRRYGVSYRNPFALLEHVGRDTPGAVQILPPGKETDDAAIRIGDVEWLSDSEVHGMIRELAQHSDDWNPGRYGGRWSLSGGQAKIALYRDEGSGRWGIPRGSTPTTHILKPPLPDHEQHHVNEVLCLKAARHLGMDTAGIDMIDDGDTRAVVMSRYDRRRAADGRLVRLHQEDMCQALSVMAEKKYQSDGGPGVAQIADLFRSLGPLDRTYSRRAFFRGLVYNVTIGGTDAHAKNYSMMLAGNRARLAPLYDIGSAAPQPQVSSLRSAMKIGKTWRMLDVWDDDWRAVASRIGLDQEEALNLVSDIREELPSAFAKAQAELPEAVQHEADHVVRFIEAHLDRRWKPTVEIPRGGPYPQATAGQRTPNPVAQEEPSWLQPPRGRDS